MRLAHFQPMRKVRAFLSHVVPKTLPAAYYAALEVQCRRESDQAGRFDGRGQKKEVPIGLDNKLGFIVPWHAFRAQQTDTRVARATNKNATGLGPEQRFTFYDHVHTTGMDIRLGMGGAGERS